MHGFIRGYTVRSGLGASQGLQTEAYILVRKKNLMLLKRLDAFKHLCRLLSLTTLDIIKL